MMKRSNFFAAAAATALLPLAALAQDPPQPAQPAAPESKGSTFESLDANGDGKISRSEAETNANVKEQFSSYDLNGDGFIERAEVTQANGAAKSPSPAPQQ